MNTNTNYNATYSGAFVEIRSRTSTAVFRNDRVTYDQVFYFCVDSGKEFIDEDLKIKNMEKIETAYRIKHGIPFPSHIRSIRESYNLSCLQMSKILGLGENQYSLYEKGSLPTESIAKLISLSEDRDCFMRLLEISRAKFTDKEYDKVLGKLEEGLHVLPETFAHKRDVSFETHQHSFSKSSVQRTIEYVNKVTYV